MSNHARGLWGYSGRTATGSELTIQATGMGGPSAAIVLADLAELGVERAVRVGTCVGLAPDAGLGDLLLVEQAIAAGGSGAAFGLEPGATVEPNADLLDHLRGEARPVTIASFDAPPNAPVADAAAADLQTVAVLACARKLEIAAAALLIVSEANDQHLTDEKLEALAKQAGRIALDGLSR